MILTPDLTLSLLWDWLSLSLSRVCVCLCVCFPWHLGEYAALHDTNHEVSQRCCFVKILYKMSLFVDILFNLEMGKSSPAKCNWKLPEFESRINSVPPSQLLFHPNHYFHSFHPHQKSSPCLVSQITLKVIEMPFQRSGLWVSPGQWWSASPWAPPQRNSPLFSGNPVRTHIEHTVSSGSWVAPSISTADRDFSLVYPWSQRNC